ncbi:MAG TPA: patatin-like phospholipase family protein [Planctomycetota bacterium]|nr:patatin-like phospholipase family protein [Planctomycetota bacterium]
MSTRDLRSRVKSLARLLKQEIDDHLLFWTALVVTSFVFVTVPQVSHIWRQIEPAGMGLLCVPFVVFLFAVICFYGLSVFTVMRPLPLSHVQLRVAHWHARRPQQLWRWLARFCWLSVEYSCRLVPAAREWLWREPVRRGTRCLYTALAALVMALAIFVFGASPDGSSAYPLAAVLCRNIGLLVFLIGLWLFWPSSTRRVHHIGPAVGRLISWFLVTSLVGEAVWILAGHGWLGVSYRLYSIWAVCHLFTMAALIALLIDRMHVEWRAPVRPVAMLVVVFLALTQGDPARVDPREAERFVGNRAHQVVQAESAPLPRPEWRKELLLRIEAIPVHEGPVVLVAASGGGSRAAIFTALVLELLARTPVDCGPIVGRSTASLPGRTFADNIVLISSVSGGSLAAADFVTERARGNHLCAADPPRNSTESELQCVCLARLRSFLDSLAKSAPPDQPHVDLDDTIASLQEWRRLERELTANLRESMPAADEAVRAQLDVVDRWLALLEAIHWLQTHEHEARAAEAGADDTTRVGWVLHSRNLDRMSTDFMAPLLRGMMSVALNRGDALARFWNELFEWHGVTSLRGPAPQHLWAEAQRSPFVIYNATDVAHGRRLAIGFPPVPENLWPVNGTAAATARQLPVVFPSGEGGMDVALARAVRMSSNFPWGFRVQEVPRKNDPLRILDGGVLDNTGLDTIFHVITALQREAAVPASASAAILEALRARGVLLLEIDSGAKPSARVTRGIAAAVVEPFAALTNAAWSQAERAKDYYLEQVHQILSPNVDRQLAFHMVLSCNADHDNSDSDSDVMTAWTLGPRDKAEVLARFFGQVTLWDRSRREIVTALRDAPATAAEMPTQSRLDRRANEGAKLDRRSK